MYIKVTDNNSIPYSVDRLKQDNPQTSFPTAPSDALLASYNVFPVEPTNRPVCNPATHKVVEGTPKQVNGAWVQAWNVVPLTAAAQQQYMQDLQASIVIRTQQRLDNFARTRDYDGILSVCTYASSAVPRFKADGQRGVELRDATWAKLYGILGAVESGARPAPTGFADIEAELPALVWL